MNENSNLSDRFDGNKNKTSIDITQNHSLVQCQNDDQRHKHNGCPQLDHYYLFFENTFKNLICKVLWLLVHDRWI